MRNKSWITAGVIAALFFPALSSSLAQEQPTPPPAPASAPTRPTTAAADPVTILKSPNASTSDRNEAARRLVADRSPEARQAIRAALTDPANRGGQIAVARALGGDSDPDPQFIDDLLTLSAGESPLNVIAIQALTNYRSPDVRARILDLARDPNRQQRDSTRVAAISALGTFADKTSAAALLQLLTTETEPLAVRDAAADALASLSGVRGNGHDVAKWQQWWTDNATKDDSAFELEMLQNRLSRFVRFQRRYDRMVEETSQILTDAYKAAPDRSKEGLLIRYLKADSPDTRIAGVQIVHSDFSEVRPISPAVRAQLRSMVSDSAADVRIEVVQVLGELNEAAALDALLTQLAREPDPDVRTALVKSLVTLRDPKVVPAIINALSDPALDVAEAAAKAMAQGLADPEFAKLVRAERLEEQVAAALMQQLQNRSTAPGMVSYRATLVEALGQLQMPSLRQTFTNLLRQGEASEVRRAAAHGLGEMRQTWAAEALVAYLNDADESVRIAAIDALKLCATWDHTAAIYPLLKSDTEPSEAVRQHAWDTIVVLLPKADTQDLFRWAERFRYEHERRKTILLELARQLKQKNDFSNLAVVNQNIARELMDLNHPDQAIPYLDDALKYYREHGAGQDVIVDLIQQSMDALLADHQYAKACDFAAKAIAENQGNQQAVGPRLRNEVSVLQKKRDVDNALKLIDEIKKMKPPLSDVFLTPIAGMEQDIRSTLPRPPATQQSTQAQTGP